MVLEKVRDEAMQAGSAAAEEYEVAEWLYVHGDERRALVDALLRELPASGRQIVKMRFWYGYKHSEIAELMHMNINTEKSIYRRSLKRLRDAYLKMIDSEDGSDGK